MCKHRSMSQKGFTPLEMKSLTGFTLIEMAIVVTILVILSATVAPLLFAGMRRAQLNTCAEQLAAHLRHGRNLAMATAVSRQFAFSFTTGGSYAFENSYRMYTHSPCATLEKDPLDASRNFDFVFSDPTGIKRIARQCEKILISAVQVPNASGFSRITFNGSGTPLASNAACGTATLTGSPYVELKTATGSAPTCRVHVMQRSGAVSVETP